MEVKGIRTLMTLATIFCVALVVSNIIAGKLVSIGAHVLPAAVFLFPVVYIIGDVIPEVFGIKMARHVILLGFITNLIAVGFYLLTIALPYPDFWGGQTSFEGVLGSTPRILLASFAGYLLGANANASIFALIKKKTGERWLFLRTIGSTIVGEYLDSIVFITIAFVGGLPARELFTMAFVQGSFKILYEVAVTPMTYWVVDKVRMSVGAQTS